MKEGNVSKDVVLALFADVDGVAEVSKGRADHVGGQNVPQFKFLTFLVIGSFQVNWGLGWHFEFENVLFYKREIGPLSSQRLSISENLPGQQLSHHFSQGTLEVAVK